jgi:hypothetical protein
MDIGYFLKTWTVLDVQPLVGETKDHVLAIQRVGTTSSVTITCTAPPPAKHDLRRGTYNPSSERIEGDGFWIERVSGFARPRIRCSPHSEHGPSTGSWTAEDTSGLGET